MQVFESRGGKAAIRPMPHVVRPINSGILTGRGDHLSVAAREFNGFVGLGETRDS